MVFDLQKSWTDWTMWGFGGAGTGGSFIFLLSPYE